MTIKLVHRISGIMVSIFIALHLFNHLWGILGAERHIAMMDTLRIVYRNIFAEVILLTAITIQLLSGVKLLKNSPKSVKTGFEKLQIYTGAYLLFFLTVHLAAVLGARYFLQMDTNFYFGVSGINTFPLNLFFIPYYGLAIMALFGHFASINRKHAKKIVATGLMLTIVLFYGFTNGFKGVEIPKSYDLLPQ